MSPGGRETVTSGGERAWTPDIIKESKKKKVPKNIKQHNSFNTDNKS